MQFLNVDKNGNLISIFPDVFIHIYMLLLA